MINVKQVIESQKTINSLQEFNANQQWHILLCFDDDYALPAGVNISSIIKNNPNYALHFHLLMQHVSTINKTRIEELATDLVSITEYNINDKLKIDAKNTKSFPVSACLRIIAPLIVSKDVKKLLYVDSDTLCLGELNELFAVNLTDKAIAAVPDVDNTQKSQCQKFGFTYGSYFNSGVILYNIEKWIQLGITEKALDLLNNGTAYKFPDQDVLNLLLKNQVYYLPNKYNTITLLTANGNEDINIADHAIFIHYVSGSKPWFKLYLTPIYQQYIQSSPWCDKKLFLVNNKSPSTTRRHAKQLFSQYKIIPACFYYILYLKHKITKK